MIEHTPEIAELMAALAKAQGAFGEIRRSRTVIVRTKAGGSYEFSYAPLDEILRAIRPALAANGLGILQPAAADSVTTIVFHSSGQSITSPPCPLKVSESGAQAFGSALTYARRYSLCALLGLVADEDDDGNHADGNSASVARARPAEPSALRPPGRATTPSAPARNGQAAPSPSPAAPKKTVMDRVQELLETFRRGHAEPVSLDQWHDFVWHATGDASWDPRRPEDWTAERGQKVSQAVKDLENEVQL